MEKVPERIDQKKNRAFVSKERSASVARYYGFSIINPPKIEKEDRSKTKDLLEIDLSKQDGVDERSLAIYPEEKVAVLRTYLEENMQTWNQPVMLYYEGNLMEIADKSGSSGSSNSARSDKSGSKSSRSKSAGSENKQTFHLDILGTTSSIAEATLIKTTLEILKEDDHKDMMVHINSIGDRESMSRFCRELGNYYRKNIESLSPHCRQLLKKDPYEVFECNNEKCQAVKEKAPSTVSYLSEASRKHFREVLEYLEALDIPYKIDNTLVCSKKMWSQTAFEVREIKRTLLEDDRSQESCKACLTLPTNNTVNNYMEASKDLSEQVLSASIIPSSLIPSNAAPETGNDQTSDSENIQACTTDAAKTDRSPKNSPQNTFERPGTLLAVGMRYNSIAKKIGFKKELGAIGVTVSYLKPSTKAQKKQFSAQPKNNKKSLLKITSKTPEKNPKIYFIQLGFDAKLKSLQVIEMLRQANIPLTQSLGKDKIGGQMQSAENSKIPYTIIMGQKEAQENTIIVREMSTRSQEIVSLSKLPEYLKKIK